MNMIDMIINATLGVSGVGIVSYLFNRWVDSLSARLSDYQEMNTEKMRELGVRLNGIETKYQNVLDIVLEKFSHWEDRLIKITEPLSRGDFAIAQKELLEFKISAREDLQNLKLRLEKISVDVSKFEMDDTQSKYVRSRLQEIEGDLKSQVGALRADISKLSSVVSILIKRTQDHERRLSKK